MNVASLSESTLKICAIVAVDARGVIGSKGGIPWHYPDDLKRFKAHTSGCGVLMGRKTFESLPPPVRPLPGRYSIVVSRSPQARTELLKAGAHEVWDDPVEGIRLLREGSPRKDLGGTVWILGGESIYKATSHLWDELILTRVPGEHDGDTFFPGVPPHLSKVAVRQFPPLTEEVYGRDVA